MRRFLPFYAKFASENIAAVDKTFSAFYTFFVRSLLSKSLTDGKRTMKDFEQLYNTYGGRLYAFCLTLTKDRNDAEELAAETLFRAVQKASFRGESDFFTWLCAIARNLFLTEEKKRKRRAKPNPPPDFDSALEDREDAVRILLAMNSLEEPYRGVFFLRTVGALPPENIARIYQKTVNWVYVVYHRAKLKILEKMEGPRE